MTHVLHLTDTYRIGGPGKTIINSAKYIDTTRYRIHVGSFTSADARRNEFASAVREAGIPYLELRENKRVDLSHLAKIRRYIRQHRIDILHTHGYRTDVMGYVATRGLRVSVVTTHHGWIRNNRRQLFLTRFALHLCRLFDGVELVSEQMRVELPRSIQANSRVAVVHNGIVLEDYAPEGRRDDMRRALGIAPGEVLIGVIGRLSAEKGCREMLEAMRILAVGNTRLRMAFIGEGPLEAELRERVREWHLELHVQFVEHQRRVQPFYEAIDLLVSPSLTEGLSNVILEALACGRPVVATEVGGNAEIVEDGVTALLVPPADPPALASAIHRVVSDARVRDLLVSAGLARVRREFSFVERMRKEERFYEAALAR